MLFTSTPLVLYSSDDVRRTLWELFKAGTERIAITAYVGEGADEYLAHPKGIRLICSPTPGATSPNTLRRLMAKGAVVEFVDALHMKVYWAKNRGTIVTSANLSKNAMGIGGLKEAGVLLGPDEVDIERLLAELDRRPAAPELHRLDVMDKAYYSKLGCKQLRKKISYKTWFTLPNREAWKLLLYAEECNHLSESSRQIVSAEFGHMPENWAWSAQGKLEENDWILLGFYSNEGVVRLSWLYVDRLELVPNSDPLYIPETPVEVIQVRPLIYYQPPPFSVPKALCDAFSHAFHKRLENEELSPFEPTVEELSEVYQHLM